MFKAAGKLWTWIRGEASPPVPQEFERLLSRIAQSEAGEVLTRHFRERHRAGQATVRFASAEELTLPDWQKYEGVIGVDGDWFIRFDGLVLPRPEETHIVIRPDPDRPEAESLALTHELRHCHQIWEDPFPRGITKEGWIGRKLVVEADAEAHVCRVAHELKQIGDSAPWDLGLLQPRRADIARAFDEALPHGMQAAMRAAHYQWGQSPTRVKDYREQAAQQWDEGLGQGQALEDHQASLGQELQRRFEARLVAVELPTRQKAPVRGQQPEHDLGLDYGR